MDIFDALTLIGGLSLFLFGMSIMGEALERRAGGGLRALLGKLTTNKLMGLFTGLAVTAVIQSSSATTVMVVGFVNSGLMTLKQSINVIMGANIGTTVTAWILSLAGIESNSFIVSLFKPTSFTPVLAAVGIILYMIGNSKKKDTGTIFLGFATLMFGMDAMSGAVSGLSEVEAFRNLFILFKNPVLGALAGAILTAIIQSSSASVGILQALAATGAVSYGAAIPIIMGQNIGTCITAILSSFGTNKNAKRTALVHLFFNIIGTVILLALFVIVKSALNPILLNESASLFGIAVAHSAFNLICTAILFPMSGLLEKLVVKLVPDDKSKEIVSEIDDRLLTTPPVALEYCHKLAAEMADTAASALRKSLEIFDNYSDEAAAEIRKIEKKTDHYEDVLGTYLVRLSGRPVSEQESIEIAKLLKVIGDFERISDHSVNLLESYEELQEKNINFSGSAKSDLHTLFAAVTEILDASLDSFINDNLDSASKVEPLEEVIDTLKEKMRTRHILRLQKGNCTIEAGFIWSDLLTNLERTSDHCSNIAVCIFDVAHNNMNIHESLKEIRNTSPEYKELYSKYKQKYALGEI